MANGVIDALVRHEANMVFDHFLKAFDSSSTYKKCVKRKNKCYSIQLNSIEGGIPKHYHKNISIRGTYGWKDTNAYFVYHYEDENVIELKGMKRKIPLKKYTREILLDTLKEQREYFLHEFIHLTDRERWSNKVGFDSPIHSLKDGLKAYINTDIESNAYMQQFLYIFDVLISKHFDKKTTARDIVEFYFNSSRLINKTEIGSLIKKFDVKYRRKLLKRIYNYAEFKVLELSI